MSDLLTQDFTTGLCRYCLKNICNSNKAWDTHHASLQSLQVSASQGCLLCCTLLDDLCDYGLRQTPWPVYRWNLRILAPTRESQRTVLLTFRSIVPDGASDGKLLITSLPDRVFHFYREQDLGRLPDIAELDARTDGPRTLSQIREWVTTCNEHHSRCKRRKKQPNSVPKRLLDITQIDAVPDDSARIRVVLTQEGGIHEPYVTLSHRWGDSGVFIQLNKCNYERLTTIGFEWGDELLPRTFKDAIMLARQMDISYVWIDSLCIIQEQLPHRTGPTEPPGESATRKEAMLMHEYYTNSFCNISTADSGSGLPGLFRSRDLTASGYGPIRELIIPPRLIADADNLVFGDGAWRVVADSLWDTQLLSNLLYTRAWVFQERMLSPRILHFSKNQVFWECSTISACEGLPDGLPALSNVTAVKDRHWRSCLQSGLSVPDRPLAGEDDESMERLWKTAVREYTRCQLTDPGDKLIAIWSVAKLVNDALDEDYLAGLWSGNLEEQLAWTVIDCRQINGQPSVRINAHNIPTWSWASLHGMIEPRDRFRGTGDLERAYHVVDHSGRKITFHREMGRSKSEPLDLPTLKTFLDRDYHTAVNERKHANSSVKSDNEPAVFKDKRIAIQGYLRQGHLSYSAEIQKWTLVPWLIDRAPEESSYMTHEGDDDANLYGSSNNLALSEVFPDLDPGDIQTKVPCICVVLAYSRDPGPMATFSGIGLMLKMIKDAHFERTGAFHFNKITKEVMHLLTFVSDQHLNESPTRQGAIDQYDMASQADDFWLV